MSTNKKFALTLTSAVCLDGKVVPANEEVSVPEKIAKNLLRRGKAVLADSQPEAEEDLDGMKVAELRQVADDLGIEGHGDMKRAELIEAIKANEQDEAA